MPSSYRSEVFHMDIAPVIIVGYKEAGHHYYIRHTFQLIFFQQLSMYHHRPENILILSFFQFLFKL